MPKKNAADAHPPQPQPAAQQQAQQIGVEYEHVEGIARALAGGRDFSGLLNFLLALLAGLKTSGVLGGGSGTPAPPATPPTA